MYVWKFKFLKWLKLVEQPGQPSYNYKRNEIVQHVSREGLGPEDLNGWILLNFEETDKSSLWKYFKA